jgi:hypothetical protein
MSAFGRQPVEANELTATPPREAGNEEHEHGGRGHMIGMVICCIPMVVAVVWVILASR